MEHKRDIEELWQMKLQMYRQQKEAMEEEQRRAREEEEYQQEVIRMAKE